MKSESEIQQLIQLAGPPNCILLRNNSGALKDKNGRTVRYGLGNVSSKQNKIFKSSDLIGITSVVVTPHMVGQTIGVFTAVEVKREDWKFSDKDERTVAQKNFLDWCKIRGGIGGFAASVEDFKKLLINS